MVRTLTYYPVAGATLAPGASAGVRIDGTLYYTHKDHPSASLRASLGSASLVTFANGNVVSETRYKAWGKCATKVESHPGFK